MSDCTDCRTYKKSLECDNPLKCYNAEWFSPGMIRYCRPQVLWYLLNCDVIRDGEWVPEPLGSSYTDPAIRSKAVRIPAHHAEYLSAEIDSRLKRCGIEGKLLEYEVKLEYALSESSGEALDYCSGFRRREESYRKFKNRRNSQNGFFRGY